MKEVREIMSSEPSCCVPEMSLTDVARIMLERDCGEVPVINNWEERLPVGVITDRDISCRSLGRGKNPMQMTVKDCMTSPAVTVDLDASVEDCCLLMEEKQIRRLPVVDLEGKCCGMVSQADIARKENEMIAGELLQQISRPFNKIAPQ